MIQKTFNGQKNDFTKPLIPRSKGNGHVTAYLLFWNLKRFTFVEVEQHFGRLECLNQGLMVAQVWHNVHRYYLGLSIHHITSDWWLYRVWYPLKRKLLIIFFLLFSSSILKTIQRVVIIAKVYVTGCRRSYWQFILNCSLSVWGLIWKRTRGS